MTWQEIRKQLPNRWLVLEAKSARSEDGMRIVDDFRVLGIFEGDSKEAMNAYLELHHQDRYRELYVLHTSRLEPEIHERFWLGVRVAQ